MKKLLFSVIILMSPLFSFSEEKTEAVPDDPTKPKIIFKKTESHKFSGITLKGQLKKPDLSYIYKRKGLRSEKIVNIPEQFNDEIIQGAGQF